MREDQVLDFLGANLLAAAVDEVLLAALDDVVARGMATHQIAVSRLVLDNFPHIKSYWQMMTAKIAQISLRFGADDMDGTVIEEKIYHDAGATTPQGMRREELERLIRAAGREPIERDTLYRPVTRTETSVTVSV